MKFDLGYQFKNTKLLEISLTHRSYLNEHKNKNLISNERLEFLGDAVLELIVSFYLYQKFPLDEEGSLTLLRSKIVQTKTLAMASERLHLGSFLRLSRGEKESGGNQNPSILADTFEAIIGAVYLDSDFQNVYNFVVKNLLDPAEKLFATKLPEDYKSLLQEKVQAKGFASPLYKIVSMIGPDHKKIFTIVAVINNKEYAIGSGLSKQEAEQMAAQKALKIFEKNR